MENTTQTPASTTSTEQPVAPSEVTPSVLATPQNDGKNNKMFFMIIGVLVIAVVAGIFYYLQMGKQYTPSIVEKTAVVPTVIPTTQPTATPVPDTSDTAIDNDTQSVDTSIQKLGTDAQGVDNGLGDKAIDVN